MENTKEEIVFKVPKLSIGPTSMKCANAKSTIPVVCDKDVTSTVEDVTENTNKVVVEEKTDSLKKFVKETLQPSCLPVSYKEPFWGGKPSDKYSLEELKSGVILNTIQLESRSLHYFGRIDTCDVVMKNPTISRVHAVLQYRSTFSATDEKKGFYLYDLESTHGTFLNRLRIKPKTYVKVHVGHLISFGCSTRMYILQGPTDDKEDESELTVTELKVKRQVELEQREREQELHKLKQEEDERKKMEQGIDWGMGEDAAEEEDSKENPFAPKVTEQLNLEDPKKTLKGWFEREGQELEYDVSEIGFGTFTCRIELPIANITGRPQIAEATVSGKKKEAIVHCALEACKILDMYGLLRQSSHESRKRKEKNWEEEDFYDSDEDNFLDRTGDIDTKRKKRMKKFGKTVETVDTYETLMEKYKMLIADLQHTKNKLNVFNKNVTKEYGGKNEEDSLESYMSDLRNYKTVDKVEIKRLKIKINELLEDKEKLRKIINIVKPATLPELINPEIEECKPKLEKVPIINTSSTSSEPSTKPTVPIEAKKIEKIKPNVEEKNVKTIIKKEKDNLKEAEEEMLKELKEAEKRQKQLEKKDKKIIAKIVKKDALEDFGNVVWKPPANQTGDGRTSLNDKYGY